MPAQDELIYLTIAETAVLLKKRKVSPVDLVEACLARIEALNPRLNAFITVCDESSRAEARRAAREIARGKHRGPLHGIPISIKDNIFTKGIRTTAGSKILADFVPDKDAAVVDALKKAGAIIIGKTNLHEFAYGVTTENPHYGTTRNPWDTSRIAGGSSGGSAVAVVTGMCFGSIGTDTGGSLRIPPALCGIVGFKPSKHLITTQGVIELSSSLDHVGPLARSVEDAALMLDSLPHSGDAPEFRFQLPRKEFSLRGLRIGVPEDFFFDRVEPEVASHVNAAAKWFRSKGAKLQPVRFGWMVESEEAGNLLAWPEATNYHARMGWWPSRASDYGEDVRKRLELGEQIKAGDYLRAQQFEQRVLGKLAENVDILLVPTTPIIAPPLGQKTVQWPEGEETVRAALLRFCRPANLTGDPAISLCCGLSSTGMPVGLQLIGNLRTDKRVLQIARAYEQAHDWHTRRPPV
jgi:aspartyl-tRNA(Asn)/glutamyl-tRNA(Gln) amidotransferase subunit A